MYGTLRMFAKVAGQPQRTRSIGRSTTGTHRFTTDTWKNTIEKGHER